VLASEREGVENVPFDSPKTNKQSAATLLEALVSLVNRHLLSHMPLSRSTVRQTLVAVNGFAPSTLKGVNHNTAAENASIVSKNIISKLLLLLILTSHEVLPESKVFLGNIDHI